MRIELELSSYGGAKVSSGLRRHVAAARFRSSAEPRVWGGVDAELGEGAGSLRWEAGRPDSAGIHCMLLGSFLMEEMRMGYGL